MQVHHWCDVKTRREMRHMERRLDTHPDQGTRRILVAYKCDECNVVIEVSRPARPGEKLGQTPRD